jgi:pimeloyl-ACP methyl ester carboxylesterase
MKIKKILGYKNRNLHLATGIGAAALGLGVFKDRKLQLVSSGIAAAELINAAVKFKSPNSSAEESEIPASEAMQSTLVDGILMRWEEHGGADNVPVIFVHGIPTGPRLWRFVIPRLAFSGTRCYSWEMVGFGSSWYESFRRDISVASQSRYLYQFLKHLNIHRAILVGHDLGGGVIQRFAVEHPGYCAGIVLTDSVAYDNWPVPTMIAARKSLGMIEKMPHQLLKPLITSRLIQMGHQKKKLGAKSMNLHWQNYAHRKGPSALVNQIKSLNNDDTLSIASELKNLDVPAKVIWGDQDPLGTESGQRLAADLKADFKLIEGGRHFIPEDHPDEIANAIKEVLLELVKQPA